MGCRYGIDGRHGSSASFGSKLLENVRIPPKQNDSSGTKATQELVDPRAIYPYEQKIPPLADFPGYPNFTSRPAGKWQVPGRQGS